MPFHFYVLNSVLNMRLMCTYECVIICLSPDTMRINNDSDASLVRARATQMRNVYRERTYSKFNIQFSPQGDKL